MRAIALLVGVSLVACLAGTAFADNKQQQERQDDQRVQAAQKALDAARQQIASLEKRVRDAVQHISQADNRQDKAKLGVQKAKERAEDQLEDSSGIKPAIAAMKVAQKQADDAAAPALEALRATSEFRVAARAAETARERLKTVGADVSLSDAEREAEISGINKSLQVPRKLEQTALEADNGYLQAKAKLLEAQGKVAELREKVRDKIEQQPEVKAAFKELDSANKDFAQAQKQVTDARQDLTKQRRELANKQQSLEQVKAADEKNDNPVKNKGKNEK